MAATATSDTELVTEHFGYPPVVSIGLPGRTCKLQLANVALGARKM